MPSGVDGLGELSLERLSSVNIFVTRAVAQLG